MKIPRFQRGYVWERSKIVKLLNSIYYQYPIGTFFIWVASYEFKHFCREITELNLPEDPESKTFSFILDGQQRITSLFVALKNKKLNDIDYSTICFNLEKKEFQIPRLKNEKHNIPAWKLFDRTAYGDVLCEYTVSDRAKADIWRDCQQIFTDYPISIIKSLKMGLEEVVSIFERINQGGKRLSLFDLVHASSWSPNFDLREKINTLNEDPNVSIFGGIENEVFTQSLSLNEFGDCLNKTQLHLTAEKCSSLWDITTKCLGLAIDYVRTLGVPHIDFIPYNSFLPILQHYFFKSSFTCIKSEHKEYIENWFWTATFSQRYSSSSLTRMKDDAEWISNLSKGVLSDNAFSVTLTLKELLKLRMQNTSVIKNGILCLLALERPVDFDNGQIVSLDKTNISKSNSKENHHFFPYALMQKFDTDKNGINRLLNFVFISSRLNKEISKTLPSIYIAKYGLSNGKIKEYLKSNLINEDAYNALISDDFNLFIQKRAELILEKIKEKTKVQTFTETDEQVVDENNELDESVNGDTN